MSFNSLCWKCAKCTNKNKCIWVKTLKKFPKGVEFGKNRDVKSCPNFEKDNFIWFKRNNATDKELAKLAGVSVFRYRSARKKIEKEKLHVTVEEYLKLKVEKGFYKQDAIRLGITQNAYNDYLHQIRRKGLDISVEEYLELKKQKEIKKQKEKIICKKFNITYQRFCEVRYYIEKNNFNVSVEEYLENKKRGKKNGIK